MQGFNMGRYVPPDHEGVLTANQASGKSHPLGSRARKLKSSGILTVRFESPFAIWCTTCSPEQIIGQGVRFNAEKKKIGNYYSTAIWSFRFKHTVCGGWIEVRTDPENAEYVVTEGGRRRDLGVEKVLEGEIRIEGGGATEEEKERLEKEGGFGALEKKVDDKKAFLTQQQRIEELARVGERDWKDPYEMSKRLRREFRVGRRQRQADQRTGEALMEKYGIGVELLAVQEDDGVRARLIDYGQHDERSASSQPLFDVAQLDRTSSPKFDRGKRGKVSAEEGTMQVKKLALQSRLKTNTRASKDPFLAQSKVWQPKAKRKRSIKPQIHAVEDLTPDIGGGPGLVSYDSD